VLKILNIEVLQSINSKKNIRTNKLAHNKMKTENMKTCQFFTEACKCIELKSVLPPQVSYPTW
jgi:hypothetical protein